VAIGPIASVAGDERRSRFVCQCREFLALSIGVNPARLLKFLQH
jgi:hypothetical protein